MLITDFKFLARDRTQLFYRPSVCQSVRHTGDSYKNGRSWDTSKYTLPIGTKIDDLGWPWTVIMHCSKTRAPWRCC